MEKEKKLGGILKSEQAIPFKREMYDLSVKLAAFCYQTGVDIRLNTEATAEIIEKENPDALIIAVGSQPLIPPIDGIDGKNVISVNNYYLEKNKVSDKVIVLGGGLAGCEAAIHLAQEGKRVTLVEMRDSVAPDANVRHRPLLLKELEKGVLIKTGMTCVKITEEGVVCQDKDKKQVSVFGTSVICALGQRAGKDTVDKLRSCAPHVAVIGDCDKVSTITNAIYHGYHAALDI